MAKKPRQMAFCEKPFSGKSGRQFLDYTRFSNSGLGLCALLREPASLIDKADRSADDFLWKHKMKMSVRHFEHNKQLEKLLWKCGRADVVTGFGVGMVEAQGEIEALTQSDDLRYGVADDMQAMKPTYVKLGHILFSQPDHLPAPYIKAQGGLHGRAEPFFSMASTPLQETHSLVEHLMLRRGFGESSMPTLPGNEPAINFMDAR